MMQLKVVADEMMPANKCLAAASPAHFHFNYTVHVDVIGILRIDNTLVPLLELDDMMRPTDSSTLGSIH